MLTSTDTSCFVGNNIALANTGFTGGGVKDVHGVTNIVNRENWLILV